MSTVFLIEKICYICEGRNKQHESGPMSQLEASRDLDGRPSGFQRTRIYTSIHRCIFCGYCAPDLSLGVSSFREIIKSDSYVAQLKNGEFPETANAFLCHTILLESVKHYNEAGWTSIHAAWICDDNNFLESAEKCRNRAVKLFRLGHKNGQSFADSPFEEQLILIDTLRKLEKFDEANSLCDAQLSECTEENPVLLLEFEKMLISKKNPKNYTVRDALEYEE